MHRVVLSLLLFPFLYACNFDLSRELEPGELRGRAVFVDESGQSSPAPDVLVRVEGSGVTVRGDSQGNFVLRNLPPGTYSLRIEYGQAGGLRLRNVRLEDARHLGDVVVGGLGSMGGRVLRANEPAVAQVILSGIGEAVTEQGQWKFPKLLPGDYDVFVTDSAGLLYAAPPVTVAARESLEIDFNLEDLRLLTTGSLQGHARLALKTKHGGIKVLAKGAHQNPALTNDEGLFAEGGLPAGVYTIRVSHEGYRSIALPHTVIGPDMTLSDVLLIPTTESCALGSTPASDTDKDGDGVPDADEPEVCHCHPGFEDRDEDGICDDPEARLDTDGDGVPDDEDNCPFVENADQNDSDGDGVGDACDNCISVANPLQENTNGSEFGDACTPLLPLICNENACIDSPRVTAGGNVALLAEVPGTERALVVMDSGVVLETDGTNWSYLPSEQLRDPGALHAGSETAAWIVDKTGQVMTRRNDAFVLLGVIDNGQQYVWTSSIWAIDDEQVWVGSDDGLWTWNGFNFDLVQEIYGAVRFIDGTSADDLWVATDKELYHWNGSSWTLLTDVTGPGDFIDGLWVSDTGLGWFIRHLADLDAGVEQITVERANTQTSAVDVLHESQLTPAVGPQERLSETAIGGHGERPWFAANTGGRNTLLRWDGGGWAPVPLKTGIGPSTAEDPVFVVAVSSPSLAWILTEGRSVLRWTGSDWVRLLGDEEFEYTSIAARASNDVLALEASGRMFRWNGTKWQPTTSPSPDVMELGAAGGSVYALDKGREVFEWTDTGWKPIFTSDPFNGRDFVDCNGKEYPAHLHVAGPNDVYVYGWYEDANANCGLMSIVMHWENGSATVSTALAADADLKLSGPTSNLWALSYEFFGPWDGPEEPLQSGFEPNSIWAGEERVFVVSDYEFAVRNGAGWTYHSTPVGLPMSEAVLWGTKGGSLFACDSGYEGSAAFRTDGTETGTVKLNLPDAKALAIGGVSETDVWFGGSGLHHYDGTNWTSFKEGVYQPKYIAVAPISGDEAFALTDRGEVFKRDANARWTKFGRPFTEEGIFVGHMKATGADNIWVAIETPRQGSAWGHWDGTGWTVGEFDPQNLGGVKSLWTDESKEVFVSFSMGGVVRFNATLSDFESVTPNQYFEGWNELDGASLSALRVYNNMEALFKWNIANETFEVEHTQFPYDVSSIASLSDQELLIFSLIQGSVVRYTPADDWVVDTSLLKPGVNIQSIQSAGGSVWGVADSSVDGYHDAVVRLGAGKWDVFEGALPGEMIEGLDVVDGAAWFRHFNAIVRLELDAP